MVDQERVCCLCGDVGFPDKLFQCCRCRFRFQHSYCSNYYSGSMELSSSSSVSTCDWCQSESRNGISPRMKLSSSSSTMDDQYNHLRSEYSSRERIKQGDHQHHHHRHQLKLPSNSSSTKNNSGVPSPRPNSHRRYKLLKDVMC